MWLPRPVYESIPFAWLAAGVIALGVAFVLDSRSWSGVLAGAGMAALVLGLTLLLRRKGYRTSRSRTDFDGSR